MRMEVTLDFSGINDCREQPSRQTVWLRLFKVAKFSPPLDGRARCPFFPKEHQIQDTSKVQTVRANTRSQQPLPSASERGIPESSKRNAGGLNVFTSPLTLFQLEDHEAVMPKTELNTQFSAYLRPPSNFTRQEELPQDFGEGLKLVSGDQSLPVGPGNMRTLPPNWKVGHVLTEQDILLLNQLVGQREEEIQALTVASPGNGEERMEDSGAEFGGGGEGRIEILKAELDENTVDEIEVLFRNIGCVEAPTTPDYSQVWSTAASGFGQFFPVMESAFI